MVDDLQIIDNFGRLGDFVRTAFVAKFTEFFSTDYVRSVISEIPNIEKYEKATYNNDEEFVSAVEIRRQFENILQKIPLIAITTIGGRKRLQSVSRAVVLEKKGYPVIGSQTEPFSLSNGDDLIIKIGNRTYTIEFLSEMFVDINNIGLDELCEVLSSLLPRLMCFKQNGALGLDDLYGDMVEMIGGSALSKLGFTPHQGYSDNLRSFFGLAGEMEVVIDVVCSDRNQRIELSDIVSSLLGFYVIERDVGMWLFDNGWILFKDDLKYQNESEQVLDNAPISKLYFNSLTTTVSAFVGLERVTVPPSPNFKILSGGGFIIS